MIRSWTTWTRMRQWTMPTSMAQRKPQLRPNGVPLTPRPGREQSTTAPHRPWCRICVEAWAREDPLDSQTQDERESGLPTICVDFCTIDGDEEDKDDSQQVLVGRDK